MLAVTLGHLESARTLLNNEANVNCENSHGWTGNKIKGVISDSPDWYLVVVQEAVATGDPELLHMVLERRDFQRYSNRMAGIPELLQRLKEAPDFYVEMKWEFTSWGELLSPTWRTFLSYSFSTSGLANVSQRHLQSLQARV